MCNVEEVIFDRVSWLCLPVDFRFTPSRTEALHCREMTRRANIGSERPFNHQTNSLLLAGIARSPISHIFIPGDMPFISFLLVAGPCAPTPSTSR